MLPCIFKQYTGVDCPFCGMQRALVLLLDGDIIGSVQMYPALLPVLLTCVFFVLRLFSFALISRAGINRLFYATIAVIFISYCIKLGNIFIR